MRDATRSLCTAQLDYAMVGAISITPSVQTYSGINQTILRNFFGVKICRIRPSKTQSTRLSRERKTTSNLWNEQIDLTDCF